MVPCENTVFSDSFSSSAGDDTIEESSMCTGLGGMGGTVLALELVLTRPAVPSGSKRLLDSGFDTFRGKIGGRNQFVNNQKPQRNLVDYKEEARQTCKQGVFIIIVV